MKDKNTAIQFPCTYPLKVMGKNTDELYAVVCAIIEKHIDTGEKVIYHSRTSSGNKYISITATFTAQSKEQLDTVYRELNGHELVLTTL
jgi:putative lipoic acid-binding regulatory protein